MKKKKDYSDEFYKMLDERYAEYKNSGVSFSRKEVNERIRKILLIPNKKRKIDIVNSIENIEDVLAIESSK